MIAEQTQAELKALTETKLVHRRLRSGASHYREPGLDGGRPIPEGVSNPKTCQWLEGEPRDRAFCGAPAQEGRPYCSEHSERAYRKVELDETGGVIRKKDRVIQIATSERYSHLTGQQIAKMVGCDVSHVYAIFRQEGITRTDAA